MTRYLIFISSSQGLHDSLHVGNLLKDYKARTDPPNPDACPYHPKPVPLPSPLPDNISKAITNLTESFKFFVLNETVVVSLILCIIKCELHVHDWIIMCICIYVCMYM